MCVIVVCETRKMTREEVRRAWHCNPHGVGIAWANNGLNCMKKGFESRKAFEKFYRKHRFPFPHILHFRWASAGAITPELTHPFLVSPHSPNVLKYKGQHDLLFHNGTFLQYKDVATAMEKTGWTYAGELSDSRIIAVMKHYSPESLKKVLESGSQRFAILKANGEVETHGMFFDHEGLKVSNTYWDRPIRVYRRAQDAEENDQPIPGTYILSSPIFPKDPTDQISLPYAQSVQKDPKIYDPLTGERTGCSWKQIYSKVRYGR